MSRLLLGLSIGSSLESVDAAIVRTDGVGLSLAPRLERTARIPISSPATGDLQQAKSSELLAAVTDAGIQAVRNITASSSASTRDIFVAGFLSPPRVGDDTVTWPDVVARIVESTGLTVVHGFRDRDRAAGGAGRPIHALTDYLLFRHDREDRLFVHLGGITSVLFLPANGKLAAINDFDIGPGIQWINAISFHGSRGKEHRDVNGKSAVQGRCLEPLLKRWLDHPHFARRPPKAISSDAFGRAHLQGSFDLARTLGAGLPHLLCTANHLIAHSIGHAWRTLLPSGAGPLRIVLTGGGTRNGFLWQLIAQQFEGQTIHRMEDLGLPPVGRKPGAAAMLAALTCDGVPGNLAPLTGAAGGRILGHIIPGDSRNWGRCSAWIADQAGEASRTSRAA